MTEDTRELPQTEATHGNRHVHDTLHLTIWGLTERFAHVNVVFCDRARSQQLAALERPLKP
eukprot:scaffold67120_cov18-Tisochrysis_lutea.AAC.1